MKLADLKAACMDVVITVASSRTGRVLIHNAMKSTGSLLELDVDAIRTKIRVLDDTVARPYLHCYANEDDFKQLKEAMGENI